MEKLDKREFSSTITLQNYIKQLSFSSIRINHQQMAYFPWVVAQKVLDLDELEPLE